MFVVRLDEKSTFMKNLFSFLLIFSTLWKEKKTTNHKNSHKPHIKKYFLFSRGVSPPVGNSKLPARAFQGRTVPKIYHVSIPLTLSRRKNNKIIISGFEVNKKRNFLRIDKLWVFICLLVIASAVPEKYPWWLVSKSRQKTHRKTDWQRKREIGLAIHEGSSIPASYILTK